MIAQMVVSAGGALGAPSISGLTLSVVGKKGYPKQQGTNEAANHTGNVAAAGLIALLSWGIGPMAAVAVLAVMAVSTLVTLWLMDPKAISADRMRGRKKRQKGEKRGLTRAVLKDRRLWILFAVIGTFQLGNSAMLPLLGQRIVQEGGAGATAWMSGCVIASSLTMIPVALAVGRMADRFGRRWLLIFACAVVIGRCALALFATGRYWLVPIEILDGIAAATFSVSAPLAIADLTYGSGRTQTAMGGMATVQAGRGRAGGRRLGLCRAEHRLSRDVRRDGGVSRHRHLPAVHDRAEGRERSAGGCGLGRRRREGGGHERCGIGRLRAGEHGVGRALLDHPPVPAARRRGARGRAPPPDRG